MKLRLFLIVGLLITAALLAGAAPDGVTVISNTTDTIPSQSAASITTAGGSFTTLLLNATTQTPRWKAYVGNVTGKFFLRDATNFTIYDWNITAIAGEVYASRNNSVTWSGIQCAQNSTVAVEQTAINMTGTKVDSLNLTFNTTTHRGFYVGTKLISNSTCRAIATYVNSTRQAATEAATFQEILLDDNVSMVYTTLLENKKQGYNNGLFDFQLILGESDISLTPTTYYFWAELS